MKAYLKESDTEKAACYPTSVDVTVENGRATFVFECESTECFCPHEGEYNAFHCEGDVCEVFIGTDPERLEYYEIELSPKNDLFVAKIRYNGDDENGIPILDTYYVEESFVTSYVTLTENGYIGSIGLALDDIKTGDGSVFFNCYRIETDGGTPDKHLFALSPTKRRRFHTPKYYLDLEKFLKGEEK